MDTLPTPDRGPAGGAGLEELERLLVQHRFRSPPAAWRRAILTAAAGEACQERVAEEDDRGAEVAGWIRWLWSGWAMVGAAWGLIVLLQMGAVPVGTSDRRPPPPLSAAARAELAAQMAALGDAIATAGGWVSVAPESPAPVRPAATHPAALPATGRPRAALGKPSWEKMV